MQVNIADCMVSAAGYHNIMMTYTILSIMFTAMAHGSREVALMIAILIAKLSRARYLLWET